MVKGRSYINVYQRLVNKCLRFKSLVDLELANPNILPPIFPAHKITTGDIVGLDEYKKDKTSKDAARWSGVVLRVTDAKITVALQEMEEELPNDLQERCQM